MIISRYHIFITRIFISHRPKIRSNLETYYSRIENIYRKMTKSKWKMWEISETGAECIFFNSLFILCTSFWLIQSPLIKGNKFCDNEENAWAYGIEMHASNVHVCPAGMIYSIPCDKNWDTTLKSISIYFTMQIYRQKLLSRWECFALTMADIFKNVMLSPHWPWRWSLRKADISVQEI